MTGLGQCYSTGCFRLTSVPPPHPTRVSQVLCSSPPFFRSFRADVVRAPARNRLPGVPQREWLGVVPGGGDDGGREVGAGRTTVSYSGGRWGGGSAVAPSAPVLQQALLVEKGAGALWACAARSGHESIAHVAVLKAAYWCKSSAHELRSDCNGKRDLFKPNG